jgi:hypothetical protein
MATKLSNPPASNSCRPELGWTREYTSGSPELPVFAALVFRNVRTWRRVVPGPIELSPLDTSFTDASRAWSGRLPGRSESIAHKSSKPFDLKWLRCCLRAGRDG